MTNHQASVSSTNTIAATPRRRLYRFVVVLMLFVACGHAEDASAGSGATLILPLPGKKVKTGLRLAIDTHWVDGTGYRPVKLSLSPLGGGAAPADRRVRVQIKPHSNYWGAFAPRVSTWIELPQGSTTVEQIVAIPQSQAWGSLEVDVYEDGRQCDDLSENMGIPSSYYGWTEATPSILFVDSDVPNFQGFGRPNFPTATPQPTQPEKLPDLRVLAGLFPVNQYNQPDYLLFDVNRGTDDNGILQLCGAMERLEIFPPQALPKRWLDYSSIDFLFISWPELRKLTADTERWEAIRRWLSTGPTLCVWGVGDNYEHLAELERLLELHDAEGDSDSMRTRWHSPPADAYAAEIHALRGVNGGTAPIYMSPLVVNATPVAPAATTTGKPERPDPFMIRAVEHGRVVAIAAENPFPGKPADWCWLFNSLPPQEWMWYQRHGMSFHRDNPEYWNLMIPGVGDAPVFSFLVLISLFVIAIGPVNYYVLWRHRRLYMLLVTVPLGAGVVTSLLFLYAVVNDGLGIRARARSFSRLDQRSGRLATWSRQSYYAGLAPSAGMFYPDDVVVYPIDHFPKGRYQPRDFDRSMRWEGDEQNLARNYLNSRSTAQLLVLQADRTEAELAIDESPLGSDPPRVTNRLGVAIEEMVLCDSRGQMWSSGRSPAGESTSLHAITAADFEEAWSKRFSANRPGYPVGFDPNEIDNAGAFFGERYYNQDVDQGLPAPQTQTSVMERGLRAAGELDLVTVNDGKSTRGTRLQPRSYIAIVDSAPDLALGVEAVQQEAGFHVIWGQW